MVVVLDACTLYPAPVRDLLLSLADESLFEVKWTQKIQHEWSKALLKNRPDLNSAQLDKTIKAMNIAFPDANISKIKKLKQKVELPDPNDHHILACALTCKAEFIVTFNLSDFPNVSLRPLGVKSIHPDIFIENLINENPEKVRKAFEKLKNRLQNPPMSKAEILKSFYKCGLPKTSELINSYCK